MPPHGETLAAKMRLRVTRQALAAADLEDRQFLQLFRAIGGEVGATPAGEMASIYVRPARHQSDQGLVRQQSRTGSR